MSRKYHINPKTCVPTICRAKQGQCPYEDAFGGDNHYDTYSEAQAASFDIMREEYGLVYDMMELNFKESFETIKKDSKELELVIGKPFADDRELSVIMNDLLTTEDEERLMRVIKGVDYPDMDWEKVGAVLQNPNLPEDFMADIFDYTDNHHLETVRLFMWNPSISEDKLFEFASSEEDDMLARCIALRNEGISEETADELMKTRRDIFSELPWHSMLGNPKLKDLESFNNYRLTEEYKDSQETRDWLNDELENYPEWREYYGSY